MPKLINWKGQVFNNCKILEPVDENCVTGQSLWLIKCHCGNYFESRAADLKSGQTKSCSCILEKHLTKIQEARKINWIGQIFHNCTILEPINQNHITCNDQWKIKCHCGKIFETSVNALKGKTTSCKCNFLKSMKQTGINKRKYNYYNYLNSKTKVLIIEPLNIENDSCNDNWVCLCPYHDPQVEFIAQASNIFNGTTTSCGCLKRKNAIKRLKKYHIKQRISKGLKEEQYATIESLLIRASLVNPIKFLILKLDNFICKKCNVKNENFEVHHIQMVSKTNYNNKESLKLVYDVKNLITLCNKCHKKAHNYSTFHVDPDIQKELQSIANNRIIPQNLLDEYNEIVKTKIEPWLDNYLKNKEK